MATRNSVKLNRIRLQCKDSDRKGIHVKSTLDDTYKLDGKTDEAIAWTDDDLIVIQNKMGTACSITLESIALPDGRRALFHPSRQPHFMLLDKEVSEIRCKRTLTLGGGESMTLVTDRWEAAKGGGRAFPV